jgi:hypothetical protein
MITLPTTAVADIIGYAVSILDDFKPVILLMLGLGAGFFIFDGIVSRSTKEK